MFSTGCVYTAKETNSKVKGKLQDAQFRICGGPAQYQFLNELHGFCCNERERERDGMNKTLR